MEKSRKTNYLVGISFSLPAGMVVHKVISLIVVGKWKLYALFCKISRYICITYLLGSTFVTLFCKCVKWGQGKSGYF